MTNRWLHFTLLLGAVICSGVIDAVPADEIDWGWRIKPTFPNEAYAPRIDVNPELTGDNHLFDVWAPAGEGPSDESREQFMRMSDCERRPKSHFAERLSEFEVWA